MPNIKISANKSRAKNSAPIEKPDQVRQLLADPLYQAFAQSIPSDMACEDLGVTEKTVSSLLEKPKEKSHGDYAIPCFRFAKTVKQSPQEFAKTLAEALKGFPDVIASVHVVSAFVNITVKKHLFVESTIPFIDSGSFFALSLDEDAHFTKVMIEYSQPNTHKEFHVGHGRNVCLGNALVNIYRYLGYDVLAANYFGDEGVHISKLLWYLKAGKKSPKPGTNLGLWLGEMYVESTSFFNQLKEPEQQLAKSEMSLVLREIESKSGPFYNQWLKTKQWSLDEFYRIYKWLDVKFDVIFAESDVSEESQKLVDDYLAKGVFKQDAGAIGVDLKDHKLGFFIARKKDGNTLYGTKDLALARRKFEDHNIEKSIYVVADEQIHHFKQVFKVLELMGFPKAGLCHHLSYGMVVLPEGKMSSRSGQSVSFWDLAGMVETEIKKVLEKYKDLWTIEEVDDTAHRLTDGAIKYGMLASDPNKEIVFVLEDWVSFEGNSGPYLMYSYSRTQSILRKGQEAQLFPEFKDADFFTTDTEHDLIRFMYDFNQVVGRAAISYKPSLLTTHLYYMCKAFNKFYAEVSVIRAETSELARHRLALVDSFGQTLKVGLNLVGIRPPERM